MGPSCRIAAGHPHAYRDLVPDLPDITALPAPPKQQDARQWVTTWRPVKFRHRGAWRIGIVKAQVQLPDSSWVLLIEHASDGQHAGWSAMVWARHDERLIVPLEAEP